MKKTEDNRPPHLLVDSYSGSAVTHFDIWAVETSNGGAEYLHVLVDEVKWNGGGMDEQSYEVTDRDILEYEEIRG